MTLDQLLADLVQNQIEIFLDGDRLRTEPRGALTVDMRAAIGEHRVAIIERLRGNALTKPPARGNAALAGRRTGPTSRPRTAEFAPFAADVGTSSGTGRKTRDLGRNCLAISEKRGNMERLQGPAKGAGNRKGR